MRTTTVRRLTLSGIAPVAVALAALASACSVIVDEDVPSCGNGVIEGYEECDNGELDGESCETFGHLGGHLVCNRFCRIETFNCHDHVCGDGYCDDAESPAWCPEDCSVDIVQCGDGVCHTEEHPTLGDPSFLCLSDCESVECGDGYCDRPAECGGCCPDDCANALFCGDGTCHYWEQGPYPCEVDCGTVECGNGTCEDGEDPFGCPDDCEGTCNENNACEPESWETAASCVDCGRCTDDGLCDPTNEQITERGVCPDCVDLPECGDGFCDLAIEDAERCPFDCQAQCGNGVVQEQEECDGSELGPGYTCVELLSATGDPYTSGEPHCREDCTVTAWTCYPRDLGSACTDTADCLSAAAVVCQTNANTEGVCTASCVQTSDCEAIALGTECVTSQHSAFSGDLCLRYCTVTADCPPGLDCLSEHCYPPEL